jgi:hypothetical protein
MQSGVSERREGQGEARESKSICPTWPWLLHTATHTALITLRQRERERERQRERESSRARTKEGTKGMKENK